MRSNPGAESLAFGSEIDELVAAVGGRLAAAHIAFALKVGHQVGEARLVLRRALGQFLLADALFLPQAAEYLKHFESDARTGVAQHPLQGLAEGSACAYDLKDALAC